MAPVDHQSQEAMEQIWAKELGERQFLVCCIPFFAKDIQLGDIVRTDQNELIETVVHRSGQFGYRVWLGDVSDGVRAIVIRSIEDWGVLIEWSSENMLAVSAESYKAKEVADKLRELEKSGVTYETICR